MCMCVCTLLHIPTNLFGYAVCWSLVDNRKLTTKNLPRLDFLTETDNMFPERLIPASIYFWTIAFILYIYTKHIFFTDKFLI